MAQILSEFTYFTRRLAEETARARRSGTRFSVVLFTSQPPDGELPEIACIQGLPAVLENVRETDCVARAGLDAIAVLLNDSSGEGSRKAALRLAKRMGDASSCWAIRILEYPTQERALADLGMVA